MELAQYGLFFEKCPACDDDGKRKDGTPCQLCNGRGIRLNQNGKDVLAVVEWKSQGGL